MNGEVGWRFACKTVARNMLALVTVTASIACHGITESLAAAQAEELRGMVEGSSPPEGQGRFFLVTIDLPVDGKGDGKHERSFVVIRPTEFPSRFAGLGQITVASSTALQVSMDNGPSLVFIMTEAPDVAARKDDSRARIVQAENIIPMWAVPPDRQIPRGTPGTGRSTHDQTLKSLIRPERR